MNVQVVAVLALLLSAACTLAAVEAEQGAGAEDTKPFEIQSGRVIIPGWDDRASTTPEELYRIPAQQFSGSVAVYRERAVVARKPAVSELFTLPEGAEELVLTGRGTLESDVFPRLRIALLSEDGGSTKTTVLHEGFAASLSLSRIRTAVPAELAGQKVRLQVEILNPSDRNDRRIYHLAYAAFY